MEGVDVAAIAIRLRAGGASSAARRLAQQARHRLLQHLDGLGRLDLDHLRDRPAAVVGLGQRVREEVPEAADEPVLGAGVGPAVVRVVGGPLVDERDEAALALARVDAEQVGLVAGERLADAVRRRRRELDAPCRLAALVGDPVGGGDEESEELGEEREVRRAGRELVARVAHVLERILRDAPDDERRSAADLGRALLRVLAKPLALDSHGKGSGMRAAE
ncbi:MAG: hypothetical protein IPI87_10685 [Betaproteobacteria bacterium]|nr:hypothetical protein [Betaproteobacteria bacterium]